MVNSKKLLPESTPKPKAKKEELQLDEQPVSGMVQPLNYSTVKDLIALQQATKISVILKDLQMNRTISLNFTKNLLLHSTSWDYGITAHRFQYRLATQNWLPKTFPAICDISTKQIQPPRMPFLSTLISTRRI